MAGRFASGHVSFFTAGARSGENERAAGTGRIIVALTGKSFTLHDLIAYQEGSVVSKTLIDKKVGTVTLFSFDSGQGLSEHTAPYDAMVQVVEGEAEVAIDGEPRVVTAGQMIIMPADRPHSLRAVKPFKMLLIMIRA